MFFDVREDIDKNIYVIGKSHSSDIGFENTSNQSNGILVKYNKDGEEQWIAPFKDSGKAIDYTDMLVLENEILIVGNKTQDGQKTGFVKSVQKSDGADKSIKYYKNGDYNTRFKKIMKNGTDYIISGEVVSLKDSKDYPMIMSLSKSGDVNWGYSILQGESSKYEGGFNSLSVDGDGNIYSAGFIKDSEIKKSLVVKLNKSGRLEMLEISKNTAWNEEAKSVLVKDGEVLTTVEKTPSSKKYSYLKDLELILRGYDMSGNIIFEEKLTEDKNIRHMDTILASSGDLLIAGRKYVQVIGDKTKCETRNTEECVQSDAYVLMVDYFDECEINNLPTITVPNKNVTINKGDSFNVMKDVIAMDENVNVTENVVATPSKIDTSIKGEQEIIYEVSDQCGKTIEKVTVNVVDPCDTNSLPIIKVESDKVVIEKDADFDVMKGVTATDEGVDVTKQIVASPSKIDTSIEGIHEITYTVDDECGKTIKKIVVEVKDSCPIEKLPVINIPEDTLYLKVGDKFNPMEGVTATDEGVDITGSVIATPNNIDTSKSGRYEIIYRVEDECGIVEKRVNVIVEDPCEVNNAPIINLNKEEITIEVGEEFNPMEGVTATDEGVDVTDRIVVTPNNVDTSVEGNYEIVYTIADNCTEVKKTLVLNVMPKNPCDINNLPVINAEDLVIVRGEEFNPMKGVTATDEGIDITDKVEIVKNTVNVEEVGEYEVVYRVEDECGATEKTIKVIVNPVVENAEDEVVPPMDNQPPKGDKPADKPVDKPIDKPVVEKPQTGDATFVYGLLAIGSVSCIGLVNRKKK